MTGLLELTTVDQAISLAYEEVRQEFEKVFQLKTFPAINTAVSTDSGTPVCVGINNIKHDLKFEPVVLDEIRIYPERLTMELVSLGFFESPLNVFLKLVKAYSKVLIIHKLSEAHDYVFGHYERFSRRMVEGISLSPIEKVIINAEEVRYCTRVISFYRRRLPSDRLGELFALLNYELHYQPTCLSEQELTKSTTEVTKIVTTIHELLKENDEK